MNRNDRKCVLCGSSPTVGRGMCRPCYLHDHYLRNIDKYRARATAKRKVAKPYPCLGCGAVLMRTDGLVGKQLCATCNRTRWAKEHRSHLNALGRARRAANPEKYRAKERAYRLRAPDMHKARRDRYIARHPERISQAQKAYYARNREREIAESQRWQREHPERHAANEASRRAKISGQFVEHVIPLAVLEFADGVCGICGEDVDPGNFQIDHIEPLFHGGEHSYANTQPAHPRCNMSKGTRAA